MKTIELLDAAKEKLQITKDSDLARALEAGSGKIANYRSGIRKPDVDVCFRLAEILNVEPSAIISAIRVEGSTTSEERTFWERHAKRYGMLKAVTPFFIIGTLATATATFAPESSVSNGEGINTSMYYA